MKSKIITAMMVLVCTLKINAQEHDTTKHQSKLLEFKTEFYPLPLIPEFNNNTIKIEIIGNYHNTFLKKSIYGVHFYYDGNTHWKEHQLEDLLTYTEVFAGWKYFQFGLEIGSLSGKEYHSFGPQATLYDFIEVKDKHIFERISIIGRTFIMQDSLEGHKMHYISGYEYSTNGFHIGSSKRTNFEISSTGMGRFFIPSYQRVLQASLWLRCVPKVNKKNQPIISFGFEWENNTALTNQHELYFGTEIDF